MPHPLVQQLRFARSEFKRALTGVSAEDACKRIEPINCISWIIGHMAWQEQRYWLWRGQNKILVPELNDTFAYGAPASTPPLSEAWDAWTKITTAADPWLDSLTTGSLEKPALIVVEENLPILFGSLMLRTTYHYWYHIGEISAIRQVLGHKNLPDFVGDIDIEAPYQREFD